MGGKPDLHERMATVEAKYEVTVPMIEKRLANLEKKQESVLTQVTAIRTILQNGPGEQKAKADVKYLKLERKMARWFNGILIALIALALGVIGVVATLVKG